MTAFFIAAPQRKWPYGGFAVDVMTYRLHDVAHAHRHLKDQRREIIAQTRLFAKVKAIRMASLRSLHDHRLVYRKTSLSFSPCALAA
jgi:hypothetical protein